MRVIQALYLIISTGIQIIIFATVALMLIRLILQLVDVNPFGRISLGVRRVTDPLVSPVRRGLINFGADPKYAPLIVILLVILVGYFALSLVSAVLGTIAGVLLAVASGAPVALVGHILYGLLTIYSLLILVRIVFSWGMVSYANPLMRFLVTATDPLLVPLRRMIPPLGMFDISPIIAFFIIFLFQQAIAATMLRGAGGPIF
jgi:YggT family protein